MFFVYLMLVVILDLLCLSIFVYTTAVTGCGVEDHTTSCGISVGKISLIYVSLCEDVRAVHRSHPVDGFHPLRVCGCVYTAAYVLDLTSLSSQAL